MICWTGRSAPTTAQWCPLPGPTDASEGYYGWQYWNSLRDREGSTGTHAPVPFYLFQLSLAFVHSVPSYWHFMFFVALFMHQSLPIWCLWKAFWSKANEITVFHCNISQQLLPLWSHLKPDSPVIAQARLHWPTTDWALPHNLGIPSITAHCFPWLLFHFIYCGYSFLNSHLVIVLDKINFARSRKLDQSRALGGRPSLRVKIT